MKIGPVESLDSPPLQSRDVYITSRGKNQRWQNTDLGTDLVAALSGLDMHDLTHFDAVQLAQNAELQHTHNQNEDV